MSQFPRDCNHVPRKYLPPKCSNRGAARGKFWRTISMRIALPILTLFAVYVSFNESHRYTERQNFIKYEHLHIRKKRFPWGDGNKTLFHNHHVNSLPDGYED